MNTENNLQFRSKTKEELDDQLKKVEASLGYELAPNNMREEIMGLSLNELKKRFPEEYKKYFSELRLGVNKISKEETKEDIKYSEEEYKSICSILNKTSNVISLELREKIGKDKYANIKEIFFPEIYERVYEKKEIPEIYGIRAGARGGDAIIKIEFSDISYMIKRLESNTEKDISQKASELGIGPKQFKTFEGYLNEEFIDGTPLLELDKEICTPEFMKSLGEKFAQNLKRLHENNILVNDQILTDDFGKSHMIIDTKGDVRFIDFGASISMENFPDFSDDEVLSLMRSDPFMVMKMWNFSNLSEEELKIEINGYRTHILSQYKTKKEFIDARDMQLLNEGLYFLSQRLPNVNFFVEGVKNEFTKNKN